MSTLIGVALIVGLLWFTAEAFAAGSLIAAVVFAGAAIAALCALLRN